MTKFPAHPPETVEELWYAIVPVLDNILQRLDKFGEGPHTLKANDGTVAFCGGPGKCQVCDKDELTFEVKVSAGRRGWFSVTARQGEHVGWALHKDVEAAKAKAALRLRADREGWFR